LVAFGDTDYLYSEQIIKMDIFDYPRKKVKLMKILLRKQTERKKQIRIKWISHIAWQNFNLLGRFEYHRQQSVIISMK
jgi:hypothetical protein